MTTNNILDEYQNALIRELFKRGYDRKIIDEQVNHIMEDVRDRYMTETPNTITELFSEFGQPAKILTEYGLNDAGIRNVWRNRLFWIKILTIQLLPLLLLGNIVLNLYYSLQMDQLRFA